MTAPADLPEGLYEALVTRALSEQLAESNDPVGAGSTVPMWA